MDYDLVTFDLDGTLVDTAAEIAEAANRTLNGHGMASRPVSSRGLLCETSPPPSAMTEMPTPAQLPSGVTMRAKSSVLFERWP